MPAQPKQINVNVQQLWLSNIVADTFPFINDSGADMILVPGTLIGRVAASSKLKVFKSTNTDGSENPRYLFYGVNPWNTVTVPNGATMNLPFANNAEVNQNAIVFALNTDNWNTQINSATEYVSGTVKDLLLQNGQFILRPTTELSNYDNPLP